MTAYDVARDYLARGWRVVPVPSRSKRPTISNWPALRLTLDDLAHHFNGQGNVGVILGDDLADVDLDSPEALGLAPHLLPTTHSVFGRASKRRSHYLYFVTTPLEPEKFSDPAAAAGTTGCLVELRGGGGQQTVFPGSIHESGEPIEWQEDGERAQGDSATLRGAVARLAVASLLLRYWPAKGTRHEAVLAAAGLLLRGLDVADVTRLLVAVARHADPSADLSIIKRDVADTAAKHQTGDETTGGTRLGELLRGDGAKVVATIRRWLALPGGPEAAHLTDTGNAERFVARHGADFRYCYAWASWLAWPDGGPCWRRDAGDVAMRAAKLTARGLYLEAAQTSDETRRKALAKWATYTESEPGLRRMLTLAQSELAITPDQLDADPWLLNCPNGTLELRTAHLRPHRRDDFLTKLTGAPYDPSARHETWDKFLEEALPDEGARDYCQRYAGYALTGDTREDVFVLLRGGAGAGKTTHCQALQNTWGDYAVAADFSVFLAKKHQDGPREAVARLAGARLVTSVETRDGARLDEGLLKQLTGGDPVVADRKYEHLVEFQPVCKLLLASNFRPRANADDDGLWRRLRELPFPTARPRREDRDDSIRATLIDPTQAGAAILAWAVEGCTRWLAEGLHEPDVVAKATAAYRRSQEPLTDFVEACCVLDAGRAVPAQGLRDAYETWAKAQGIRHPLSGKAWGQALRALGCLSRHTRDGEVWDGIDLSLSDAATTMRDPGEDSQPW